MPAFYLTFVAVLIAGIGARDQITLAGLGQLHRRRPAALIVAIVTSAATAALAGYGATLMLAQLPPPARTIFAAIALGMAGVESMVLAPRRNPREPTNSLGALGLVLLAHQVTDAPRFLVFGLGVGLAGPWPAAVAGMLGGTVLVTVAWARPELITSRAARWTRRIVGTMLLIAALVIFLRRTGIL